MFNRAVTTARHTIRYRIRRGPLTSKTLRTERSIHRSRIKTPSNFYSSEKKRPIHIEALDTLEKFCVTTGIDELIDAESLDAEILGTFHCNNTDSMEHITVKLSSNGAPCYFRRKSDGTCWNALHVPRDIEENQAWFNEGYDHITEQEWLAYKKSTTESYMETWKDSQTTQES